MGVHRPTIRSRLRLLFLALFCVGLFGCSEASRTTMQSENEAMVPGEISLEGRLRAPCCWTQTLDVHESELSTSLRKEIRARLRRGESTSAIEDDLALRYGERIRTVPRGRDPRNAVPAMVGLSMVLSAIGLIVMVRRWARRSGDRRPEAGAKPECPPKDVYDEQLDSELSRLDD